MPVRLPSHHSSNSRRTNHAPYWQKNMFFMAGEYTAVYPQESPGGWQLIGRTAMPLFDPQADPPAPMRAGVRIRFEEVGR